MVSSRQKVAYASGAIQQLRKLGVQPEAFFKHAYLSQQKDIVKVANLILEGIELSKEDRYKNASLLGDAGRGLLNFAGGARSSAKNFYNAAQQGDTAWQGIKGHAANLAHESGNLRQNIKTFDNWELPKGVPNPRVREQMAANKWNQYGQLAAPALAAGGATLGLGGLAYGMQPADTWSNKLKGMVGMSQDSRFDNLFS